jgi:hypothetical protein
MNGYNIRIFTKNDGLPTNDIWKLYEDSKGRVWLLFHGNEIGYISDNRYHSIRYESNMVRSPYFIRDINGNIVLLFRVGWKFEALMLNVDDNLQMHIKLPDTLENLNISSSNKIFYSSKIDSGIRGIISNTRNPKIKKFCSIDFISYSIRLFFTNSLYAYGYAMGSNNLVICNLSNCKVDTIHTNKLVNKTGSSIYIAYDVNDTVYVYTRQKILIFNNKFKLINTYHFPDSISRYTQVSWMYNDNIGREILTTKHNGAYIISGKNLRLNQLQFTDKNEKYTFLLSTASGHTYWLNDKLNELLVLDNSHNVIHRKKEIKKINALTSYNSEKVIYSHGNEFTIMDDRSFNTKSYYENKVVFIENFIRSNYSYTIEKMVTETKAKLKDGHKDRNLNGVLNLFYDKAASVLLLNAPEYAGKVVENIDSLTFYNDDYERFNRLYYFPSLNIYFHYNDKHIAIRYGAYGKYVRLPDNFLSMIDGQSITRIFSDNKYNAYIQTNNKLFVFSFRTHAFREIRMPFNISDVAIKCYKDYLLVAGKQGIAFAKVDADKLTLSGFRFISQGTQSVYNSISDFIVDTASGTILLNTDKGIFSMNADSLIKLQNYYLIEDGKFMRLNTTVPITKTINQQDTLFLGKDDNTIK